MKRLFLSLLACMSIALLATSQDVPQKVEMRSAWVATVWRLDWPSSVISQTGNASQINRQKQDMITLLDSMAVNNLNAINFQIRDRADALYKSSYEPWSSEVVSDRGMDPGYDPLAFVVEECHKRGIECHAWINPYRYESVIGQWDGTPMNYRKDHPDWLLDYNNNSILNPGLPEVTQRICDIIAEVVRNYDVDGVLFDDYFYISGTPNSLDADLYNKYKAAGGTLNQGDWRRDNVNRMVAAVYKTIKDIKPWVRFGISPAGIAGTQWSVAQSHGVTPCPTGSDWQYSSIFSDPLAWIEAQDLDYISPQIYWTIGNGTDYDKATKWWSEVANKFGRHLYVSHSISSLTASSKMPGSTRTEEFLAEPQASGPNSTSFFEYANEIRLNRQYTLNGAPGSIFYSCKYLYKTAPLFAHYLRTTVFNTHSLMPAMLWHEAKNPGFVSNITRNGNKLAWTGKDNMRYTVYAVPNSVSEVNFNREAEYLLGVSYATTFTIPDNRLSGYKYAVCMYDRYGNEYSPMFMGAALHDLDAPVLTAPANKANVEHPFDFEWKDVKGAGSYIIEVSDVADMATVLYSAPVTTNKVSSAIFAGLPIDQTLYWRVRSCAPSSNDGVSETRSFTASMMRITAPETGATEVSLTPTLEWSFPERSVDVQIATSDEFNDGEIVVEGHSDNGSFTVPKYRLQPCTTYYVRMFYTKAGMDAVTPVSSFTTLAMVPEKATFVTPVNGGNLHSDQMVTINPIEGANYVRIEMSESQTFPARTAYVSTSLSYPTWCDNRTADQIKVSSKTLVDGKTYYLRARVIYRGENGSVNGEFCDPIAFTYRAEPAGVDDIAADNAPIVSTEIYNVTGAYMGSNVESLNAGTYIRVDTDANGRRIARPVVR